MAKTETKVSMLNAIRDIASDNYKNLVPLATTANLQDVGNPILSYSSVQNEFIQLLVNKVGLTIVRAREARNPLAMLKKGSMPLGLDVEEIAVNPAKATAYNAQSTDLLAQTNPDVKAAYHRLNRQDRYAVTIQFVTLRQAFTSWEKFDVLIDEIVNSLYSGNYIDEFALTKKLLGTGVTDGKIQTQTITLPTDAATGRAFTTALRAAYMNFGFPSANYNAWALNQGTGDPFITWSDPSRINLILRSDIAALIDVEVLAAAFNMSKADFLGRVIYVDNFDTASNVCAIMCDEAFTQIYDVAQEFREFNNGSNLTINYWYHVWQIYSLSPLANALAFVTASSDEGGDG